MARDRTEHSHHRKTLPARMANKSKADSFAKTVFDQLLQSKELANLRTTNDNLNAAGLKRLIETLDIPTSRGHHVWQHKTVLNLLARWKSMNLSLNAKYREALERPPQPAINKPHENSVTTVTLEITKKVALRLDQLAESHGKSREQFLSDLIQKARPKQPEKQALTISYREDEASILDNQGNLPPSEFNLLDASQDQCCIQILPRRRGASATRCKTSSSLQKVKIDRGDTIIHCYVCRRHFNQLKSKKPLMPHQPLLNQYIKP